MNECNTKPGDCLLLFVEQKHKRALEVRALAGWTKERLNKTASGKEDRLKGVLLDRIALQLMLLKNSWSCHETCRCIDIEVDFKDRSGDQCSCTMFETTGHHRKAVPLLRVLDRQRWLTCADRK